MIKKVAIVGLGLFSVAWAQTLSLQDAIKKAEQNAFNVKAKSKEVEAKKYQYKAAKGLRWPSLTLYSNFLRTNNPGYAMMNLLNQKRLDMMTSSKFVDMTMFRGFGVPFGSPSYPEVNNWQNKFQLQLPIFTGFKIPTAIDIRKKDYESSKKELIREKEKSVYNVIKAYKGALLAKEGIKIATEAYKTAKKHYEVAQKMYKEGMAIYADVLRAKIYMMDMESRITNAKANYLTAKKALLLAMGETKLKPEDIDVIGELECKQPQKDVSFYQNIAISERKDLKAIRDKVGIAKDMIKLAKSDFYPQVGAFAYYETDSKNSPVDPDGKWWGAGVGLTWNLFNGFQKVNKYKAAKQQYASYFEKYRGFKEFIKFNVYKAYNDWLVSIDKFKTKSQSLKYAEEVLKITEKSYENQMASMLDLIDTQTMRDKANFDLAQAKYQCEISYTNLLYQSGLLKNKLEDK